mmetsp:Transcript_5563/g.7687  ORF Transcript_5563/g.7687 Transcript_5563/m.7687 type:complete len:647 (-) Transcript_5563:95-2035(-)|eukprot:CAMPEP_0117753284 /NCGR_PEP_ID=MMETSP0947-20121206/12130_1 /TAXON_ID=44440 /ORGANISM="Chattonella subsalsa, Strain CCMP2191" /LENGTH=646 /DNA_ID=CAMNT_0005572129 /DNA_START=290 /DNA_END=2230 /DNA_ORIENTATION=+
MNSAIHHAARPGDFKKESQAPMKAQLSSFCRQMGLDPKELGPQAENIWSMLDDLAENDPEGYKKFLEKQRQDHETLQREREEGPSFTPKHGFVVKARVTTSADKYGVKMKGTSSAHEGEKVFLNFCHHAGVEPPTDQLRNAVMGPRTSADGLQVPMLISDVRDCLDNNGELCHAVDVIFNSWVIEQTKHSPPFKKQVIQLGLQWVCEESQLNLSPNFRVIKALYKGGSGEKGIVPRPFPLSKAKAQSTAPEERTLPKEGKVPEGLGSTKSITAATTPLPPVPPIALNNLKTPKDLIKQCVSTHDSNSAMPQFQLPSNHPSPPKGPLIEEVQEKESSTQSISKNKVATSSNTDRKSGNAVKKGFLNKTKNPKLYEDGGSIEGAGPGAYAKFMDRCKVVDMNNMSKEEQDAMMRQHAGVPSHTKNKKTDSNSYKEKPTSYPVVKKGFLDGTGSSLYPEGSEEGGVPSSQPALDMEFEELMQKFDPELANGYRVLEEDPDPMAEQLADLAKALTPLDSSNDDNSGNYVMDQKKSSDSNEYAGGAEDCTPAKANTENATMKCDMLTFKMEETTDSSGGKRELTVFIHLDQLREDQYSCLDLQATPDTLQVSSSGIQKLNIHLPFIVNADSIKASLKRRAKHIKVKLLEAD